jgi:hypothetical protein
VDQAAALYDKCCSVAPECASYALNAAHVYEVVNRPRTALHCIRAPPSRSWLRGVRR